MDGPRPEKVAVVDEVRERLDATTATILAEYRGLDVAKLAALRTSLRAAGGDFKVYKNTLVRFAARDLGLEIEDLLTGPTALAFVTDKPDGTPGDAVDVAKVLKDFGRDNPALVVKGGVLGDKLLSADDARALADVEPREVLLARLAGGMAAPMQKFAGLLQALPRNFAYGLKALVDQGGAPGAPAAAEAPADDAPVAEAPEDTSGDAGGDAPDAAQPEQATGAVGGAPEGEAPEAGTEPPVTDETPSEDVTANADTPEATETTEEASGDAEADTENQES